MEDEPHEEVPTGGEMPANTEETPDEQPVDGQPGTSKQKSAKKKKISTTKVDNRRDTQ